MPNAAGSQDIAFQPITEGYSYSANGGFSKKYGVYLLVGIILLITILLAAFAYLNNFGNIKTATTKQEYLQYTKKLDKPFYNQDLKQTVVSAIFIGINKNNLEAETSEGKMTFAVNSNTILQNLIANTDSNATNGGTLDSGQTYTLATFANQVPKSSFLQIFYITGGKSLKAIKIYYFPDYEFNN